MGTTSRFTLMLLVGCLFGTAPAAQSPGDSPGEILLSNIRQVTFEGKRAGESYFSPQGNRMVFQSERDTGNPFFQIFLMDLETGDTRRVSSGVGKTTCAWIHPDGRILFHPLTTIPKRDRSRRRNSSCEPRVSRAGISGTMTRTSSFTSPAPTARLTNASLEREGMTQRVQFLPTVNGLSSPPTAMLTLRL